LKSHRKQKRITTDPRLPKDRKIKNAARAEAEAEAGVLAKTVANDRSEEDEIESERLLENVLRHLGLLLRRSLVRILRHPIRMLPLTILLDAERNENAGAESEKKMAFPRISGRFLFPSWS